MVSSLSGPESSQTIAKRSPNDASNNVPKGKIGGDARVGGALIGPSRTKNTTESEFSAGTKVATTIAKRYGECSDMLVFLGR